MSRLIGASRVQHKDGTDANSEPARKVPLIREICMASKRTTAEEAQGAY
jgi:hypothetical protein